MELINIAEQQITSETFEFKDHPFFREYFHSFQLTETFEENAKELMQSYTLEDVFNIASFLASSCKDRLHQINTYINQEIKVGIIIFFGDCCYDGHGILIDHKPYVFFDLNAIIPRRNIYNFKMFVTHEILHAIHYFLNPEFYPKNHHTSVEQYLKLLFSEGIATYLSYQISGGKIEHSYWFGYLTTEQVGEWMKNCKQFKKDIGIGLRRIISEQTFEPSLYNRLFGIEDLEKITSYRTGYFYGAEIVKNLLKKRDVNDVLTLHYSRVRQLIMDYFHV